MRKFMETRGLTPNAWAKRAGVSEGTIRNYLAGRSASLNSLTTDKLAAAADSDPSEIFGTALGATHGTAVRAAERPGTLDEDVPVLGYGRGGPDGFFFDNGTIVDRVARPASLRNVPDAYASTCTAPARNPRIRHGELCFVHPYQPPGPGDDVVVQLDDGRGYIKTYVHQTAGEQSAGHLNERLIPYANKVIVSPTDRRFSYDDLDLLQRYKLSSSFIAAWYDLNGDEPQRDQTAHSYTELVAAAVGEEPVETLRTHIEYEQLWRRTMKREGVSPRRRHLDDGPEVAAKARLPSQCAAQQD